MYIAYILGKNSHYLQESRYTSLHYKLVEQEQCIIHNDPSQKLTFVAHGSILEDVLFFERPIITKNILQN